MIPGSERVSLLCGDVMFTDADLDHDQLVSGNEIKDIFLQSGLPQMVLAHIWNICDREADLGAVRAGHVANAA